MSRYEMSMFSVRLCLLHVRLLAARASGFPKVHRYFTRIASAIRRTRPFSSAPSAAEALRQVPEVLCKIVQMPFGEIQCRISVLPAQ